MELKDDSGTNPCCILWKAKYAKLQQKNTRAEEGRSALKQALAVFESEYDKMKKDYEKAKMRVDNERMAKEKESAVRVALENEISSLKSEVLSLSQKGSSVPESVSEELKLLQGRVSEKEKELKCLQEEKRRANEACESSKAEKNRVDQELSKLKAQLLKVETETKHLKKDLQKEKARADSEKKRADEVLKTAKTEQAELDVLKAVKNNINDLSSKSEDKSLETEIGRLKELLDKEKKRADSEKKRADEALKTAKTEQAELEVLKAVKNNINDLSSKSENKSLETEIGRLKELLDKEKKRADIETKKAETERKSADRLKEMLKSEQSKAIEQTKLVDVERKKAEEFALQLQKLKCEADEAKTKLVSEGSKFKDANNKKIEAERKKTIKEKKKAEEQQKIAEMSTKHALEEKQRADMFKQQAMSEKARADTLAKELEDTKQRTKKASAELTNPSVVLVQKDLEAKSAEMKLLKKRLKLEKERVKHADKVAELEKKCKKVVEEELHQLKLEFARFSSRIGLCNCFSVGKSCLEKDGNVNSQRKFAHPVSGEALLLPISAATKTSECLKSSLDSPASALPISRNCTESTSGTASRMEPLLGGSNRKNLDSSALVSTMASFSDRQLVSSQGICRLSNSKENSNLQLSSDANHNVKSPVRVGNKDGNSKKRKRLVNIEGETGPEKIAKTVPALHGSAGNMDTPLTEGTLSVMSIEKNGELGIRTVGDEDIDHNATHTCNSDLEVFKGMFDGDCLKLLNLDNEVEEEMYRAAVERPLSPTLPTIELPSSQSVEPDDSRSSEVTCNMSTVNTNGDSLEMLRNGESGNTIIALIPSACSEDQNSIAVTGNSDLGHTGTKTSSGNEPRSAYDDFSHYIVVFPEIKDGGSLSKILHTTKTITTQCCAFSQSEVIFKNAVFALSIDEGLSPKEKVCAFFSLFLKSFSSIASTKFSNLNDENFFDSIDVFSAQLKKVISEEEIRTMFTKVCDLDELLTLIQSFLIDGRVLCPVDIISETLPSPDSKASLHQLVLGAVLLASVCAAFDCIDFIVETSFTISSITSSSTLIFLHVFAYVCGEKLLAHGDYSLIMTLVKSLVAYCERENLSPGFPQCAKCPFSDGAVSMEELALLLLKQLSGCSMNNHGTTTYKLDTVPDDSLSNLGDVLSLLELLASKMSWGWVCKNIVRESLKLLEVCVVETSLTSIYVLLGQMARLGIEANGFQDTEVENIRVKLSSFISQNISNKTNLPVQFAVVNSLVGTTSVSFKELCKLSPLVSTSTGTDCIQKWFSLLSDEQKLLSARVFNADVF